MQKQSGEELKNKILELEEEKSGLEQLNSELRKSNKKYRQLLENLNEVLYILDRNAAVAYVTPNVRKIGGYSPEEIIGRSFTDFVYPEDLENRIESFQKILSGEDLVTEYRYLTKSGELVWVRTNARPIVKDGRIEGIQGILVDITDLKEAEEEARRSEKKFRDIFDNASDSIYIHEMDGTIIEANEVALRHTGYSREELLQMNIIDLTGPEHASLVKKKIEAADKRGKDIYELVHKRKDGLEFPVEIKTRRIEFEGRPCILAVARDITERKIREDVLYESERQKDLILNSTAEKIIYFDRGLRIIWANRSAARWAGKSEEELVGEQCFEVLCQRNSPCSDCIVRKAGDAQSPQQRETKTRDGRYWLERAYPSVDETGKAAAVALFAQDITELKRSEAEKAELQEQFYQSQKLESIGRLAGGIAHDLNNLLSPILGYGEMLLEDSGGDDYSRKQLDSIMEAAGSAQSMVRQLLAFSCRQTLDFRSIDMNDLLKNFENLLRCTRREDIAVNIRLADSLPLIKGDSNQLEHMLINLAVNAQDAMQGRGRLTVETGEAWLDEHYAKNHKGVKPGRYVRLTVSDTGYGMEPEVMEHIFEPFFTTKEQDKGTGLGLSTAYGIVRQHGGEICAYSEQGLGSTFKIYLPAEEPGEIAAMEGSSLKEAEEKFNGSETVLLAEDDKMVREMIISMLQKNGYRVISAQNGTEALSMLRQHGGPVHMLLTDVVMPDINGKELYRQASSACPDLKAIYMSGYSEDVITHQGVLEQGVNFIQKPFSMRELTAKIREVLSR